MEISSALANDREIVFPCMCTTESNVYSSNSEPRLFLYTVRRSLYLWDKKCKECIGL